MPELPHSTHLFWAVFGSEIFCVDVFQHAYNFGLCKISPFDFTDKVIMLRFESCFTESTVSAEYIQAWVPAVLSQPNTFRLASLCPCCTESAKYFQAWVPAVLNPPSTFRLGSLLY